ncbi:hypothetical protein BD410DRAFT_79259 [Rickenella mellea]|uniref:Uncharacterized protein n=1 Tax=Rickenella mellea TaxID=50990 RepID=A0A4Y7PMA4_9AGAM|nr:hypothetical protein BD410DRAFT_79259 [Rickenella mellea]
MCQTHRQRFVSMNAVLGERNVDEAGQLQRPLKKITVYDYNMKNAQRDIPTDGSPRLFTLNRPSPAQYSSGRKGQLSDVQIITKGSVVPRSRIFVNDIVTTCRTALRTCLTGMAWSLFRFLHCGSAISRFDMSNSMPMCDAVGESSAARRQPVPKY